MVGTSVIKGNGVDIHPPHDCVLAGPSSIGFLLGQCKHSVGPMHHKSDL